MIAVYKLIAWFSASAPPHGSACGRYSPLSGSYFPPFCMNSLKYVGRRLKVPSGSIGRLVMSVKCETSRVELIVRGAKCRNR